MKIFCRPRFDLVLRFSTVLGDSSCVLHLSSWQSGSLASPSGGPEGTDPGID